MTTTLQSAPQTPHVALKYSYAALDPETASNAKDAALRIRKCMFETAANFIDIGWTLIDIKKQFSHGQFGDWINVEFNMSMRSAQNFMSAADLIGNFSMDPEVVQAIPQTLLYQLSGKKVPGEIVADLIEHIEAGNKPDVPAVMAQIKASKPKPGISTSCDKKVSDLQAAISLLNILKEHLPASQMAAFRKTFHGIKSDIFKSVVMHNAGAKI